MDLPSDRIWGEVGTHLRAIVLGQTVTRFPDIRAGIDVTRRAFGNWGISPPIPCRKSTARLGLIGPLQKLLSQPKPTF